MRGCSPECEARQLKAWMARWVVGAIVIVTAWFALLVAGPDLFGWW